MLPQINGKTFLELTEADLQCLIDNPDYRENEYIDYKKNFAFLEIPKNQKDIMASKVSEFRNDICAFANAEGGYLVFGISDENGCAKEIIGINIDDNDTDRFELNRRNNLNSIYPRTPYIKFHFIKLQNDRYVIIIYVKSDSLRPYTHIINESSYPMYKRIGNGKRIMTYMEMKNMFNQSLSLDKEIYKYRMERIEHFRSQAESELKDDIYSRFLLLHIIPETFLDSSYNHNMLILEKMHEVSFSQLFEAFNCSARSVPCVDGLKSRGSANFYSNHKCFINNNGIVECFMPLRYYIDVLDYNSNKTIIHKRDVWDAIEKVYKAYFNTFQSIYKDARIFVGISIIGCKGIIGEFIDSGFGYIGQIDRNTVLCSPVVCDNMNNDAEIDMLTKKLYIEYLISIGSKHNDELNKLIDDVYNI